MAKITGTSKKPKGAVKIIQKTRGKVRTAIGKERKKRKLKEALWKESNRRKDMEISREIEKQEERYGEQ